MNPIKTQQSNGGKLRRVEAIQWRWQSRPDHQLVDRVDDDPVALLLVQGSDALELFPSNDHRTQSSFARMVAMCGKLYIHYLL